MFKKILIANRGEIAARIAKTVQQMGIKAVMLHWRRDENRSFLQFADEIASYDTASPLDLYLSTPKIIEAAKRHNIDAIHPGYGFLAENPEFAEACEAAKIAFIGPTPSVLRTSGNKLLAKNALEKTGIPVMPSEEVSANDPQAELKKKAKKVGYPLVIKAAAGGGGKGMRLVRDENSLISSCESASREAQSAFGSPRIFFEHYLERPHHVEVQIVGDHYGNLAHCFERECSIQRRYQKIIEESPSPSISKKLRSKIIETALKIAKIIGYTNAGTFEFLVGDNEKFYFLEINPRIQVEHPVTEMTAGADLIRTQILAASGEKISTHEPEIRGHAIECRINAEDPAQNFSPCTGALAQFNLPNGPGIRVDTGSTSGDKITVHYDSLIAKVIVWDETRELAVKKMVWALNHFEIAGITTNLDFLKSLVNHPNFIRGNINTHFIEEHAGELVFETSPSIPIQNIKKGSHVSPWEALDKTQPSGPVVRSGGAERSQSHELQHEDEIRASMPGRILKIPIQEKQHVSKGDPLIVMESMKMELTLSAPKDAKIEKISVQTGGMVEPGQRLIKLNYD